MQLHSGDDFSTTCLYNFALDYDGHETFPQANGFRPKHWSTCRSSLRPRATYSANDDKRRRLQPEVLLVGTVRGKEIIFDTLTPAKRAALREAMSKERSRRQQFKATIW